MSKEKHPTQKTGRKPRPVSNTTKKQTQIPSLASIKSSVIAFWSVAVLKAKDTNKNFLLASSLALVLLIVGTIAVVTQGGSANNEVAVEPVVVEASAPKSKTAIVTLVEGTLQIKDAEGDWTDAEQDIEIGEDDALRTVGATSRAVATFEDNSQVRLDANSEINIISLTDERIVVQQLTGYVYSRVLPSPSGQQYVIKTTDAQYEALGTAFRTSATGDEQAVEVFHNSVIETQSNKRATEGKKFTAKSNANPSENKTLTDLKIEDLKNDKFIQWNIELDEENDLYKNDLGFLSDTQGPELLVTSHKNGDIILLEPNATGGTIEISGTAERNTKMSIKNVTDGSSQPVEFTAGEDSKFISPVIQTALGDIAFEITATDRAGNETKQTIRITFQKKSAAITTEQDEITLSVTLKESEGTVQAFWVLTGELEAPDGFKLVYDKNANPQYPDDDSEYIESANTTTLDIADFDKNKSYYFRVCVYDADEDECSLYSNQVKITPNKED